MFDQLRESWMVIQQTMAPVRMSKTKMVWLFAKHTLQQQTSPLLCTIFAVTVILTIIIWQWRWRPRGTIDLGLPVVGSGTNRVHDFDSLLHEGAEKYPGQLFIVRSSTWDYVICPSHLFDEVKRLPITTASLQSYLDSTNFGKYTNIGHESPAMFTAIQLDLARAAPSKVQTRQAMFKANCDRYIGVCDDWTPFEVLPVFFKIITRINASALLGAEVGDTDQMATLLMRYLMSLMIPVMFLNKCPPFLIPVVAQPLFLWHQYVKWCVRRLLGPVIERDIERFEKSPEKAQADTSAEEGRVPFTAWLLARHKTQPDMDRLILDYMLTLFEATPSTSSTLYSVLFDIAAHPEVADILRQEIRDVAPDGKLPLGQLHELHRMDSVMRESLRANAFSLFALHRRLVKPIQLSTGPPLPAGTYLCVDAHSIHTSKTLWDKPEQYDPLRFHNLRLANPETEEQYRFTTSDGKGPHFGGGTQGCPGRIWASSTIKIMLTHLLMHYDIKLRPGDGMPVRTAMPNGTKSPDFKAKILLRSRKGGNISL